MAETGVFIPDITVDMLKKAPIKAIAVLLSEGEILDIDIEEIKESAYQHGLRQNKWIPVSEELPKEEECEYMICTDTGYMCLCRWTNDMFGLGANEYSEWGWHIMDRPQYTEVVAWMFPPERYMEVK